MLRSYPVTLPEPIDALVSLMTSTSGWVNGELEVPGLDLDASMNYDDVVIRPNDSFTTCMSKRAQVFQRKLLDSQMDGVVENPTDMYFRQDYFRSRTLTQLLDGGYSLDMAFLNTPQHIQKDWGNATLQFQDWLDQQMRNWHRVQISRHEDDDGISHWSKGARGLMEDTRKAKEKLYPLVYGISYQEHLDHNRVLAKKLVSQMLEEERRNKPKR